MKFIVTLIVALSFNAPAQNEVWFYSEGVKCYGKLYLPKDFSQESKLPAIVLAPGSSETARTTEQYAAYFAERGLIAMVMDYRGWGRSGGYVELVDNVQSDDRLRFSQMTAKVRIRRKRLLPQQQILDIRNALYYLQGEPGVDRNRIGVWGSDLSGGHAIVIAATDARVKAVVAQAPYLAGKEAPRHAQSYKADLLAAEQNRARTGQILSAVETRVAMAEYHPFWYIDQIPEKTAVQLVTGEKDGDSSEATKLLKGPSSIVKVPAATPAQMRSGASFEKSASAAADWFLKHL